jgi:hypothetical protein
LYAVVLWGPASRKAVSFAAALCGVGLSADREGQGGRDANWRNRVKPGRSQTGEVALGSAYSIRENQRLSRRQGVLRRWAGGRLISNGCCCCLVDNAAR